MRIEFDPEKDARNLEIHGYSLAQAEILSSGSIDRLDYGEVRVIATGEVAGRVCICVYTRRGEIFRPISLRPASRRERDAYAKEKTGRQSGSANPA